MAWRGKPTKFAIEVKGRHQKFMGKVAMDVLAGVVKMSPVDTGRFRANWLAGVNSPPSGTTDSTDRGGSSAIAKGTGVFAGAPFGARLWVVNNLPYAERLENGWSMQAPSGMVEITVARVKRGLP